MTQSFRVVPSYFYICCRLTDFRKTTGVFLLPVTVSNRANRKQCLCLPLT